MAQYITLYSWSHRNLFDKLFQKQMKITSTVFRKNVKKKKSFYSTGIRAVSTPGITSNIVQETVNNPTDLQSNDIYSK